MTEWYEDDEFWESFAPYFFTADRIERSGAQADELIKLIGVGPGSAVLDLCCGRCWTTFNRAGTARALVTGVDRTRTFLTRAEASARKEGVSVEWVREDMRSFKRSNGFDGAIQLRNFVRLLCRPRRRSARRAKSSRFAEA